MSKLESFLTSPRISRDITLAYRYVRVFPFYFDPAGLVANTLRVYLQPNSYLVLSSFGLVGTASTLVLP